MAAKPLHSIPMIHLPLAILATISQAPDWEHLLLPSLPSVTGSPVPITASSLLHFLFALLWAGILLISFAGWGRGTARLLRVGQTPASVACSLGIATVIFLGGILNLLQALYVPVLFALVGIGFVLYLWLRNERPQPYRWLAFWRDAPPVAKLLIILTLLILAFRVAATVRLGGFNIGDDSAGYLVFPQKLLAMHHFAADPFSDRRVISSLGGAYLLQALSIAATTLSHIAMSDRTLGLVLLAVAIFDIGTLFELSPLQIAWMELLAYLVPQETINLTFVMLPVPLLLGMVWLLFRAGEEDSGKQARDALLAGLIGGAIVSLKSTYLPVVGAFALIPFLFIGWRSKTARTLRLPLFVGIGCLVVLISWMVAMKMASGTYLFPIFGPGFDYSAHYGIDSIEKFPNIRTVIKVFLQGFVLVVLAGVLMTSGMKKKKHWLGLSILIASAVAITAFNFRSGGDFIWRYNFPQFFCAILIFYAATASAFRERPRSSLNRAAFCVGALSIIGMMFYYDVAGHDPQPFRQMLSERKDYRPALRASLTGTALASPALAGEYRAVENSIPDRGAALEDVGRPYLFDYRNHNIYVMDWPGAAGPPPGWPFGESSDRLVDYLRRNSVRYVIYDYRFATWDDAGACVSLERPKRYSRELYVLFWMKVLSSHQLDLLRTQYRSIYDDGKIAVIDLVRPLADAPADGPVWTFQTNIDSMCTEVMDRYRKNPLPTHPE